MKKLLLSLFVAVLTVSLGNAQYLQHTQTYYQFDSSEAQNNCIVNSLNGDGYVIAPYGSRYNSQSFMGLLKVNNDFTYNWKSLYIGNPPYASKFFTRDLIIDQANDQYILCGDLDSVSSSFISVFDANGLLLWMKKYINVSRINSILAVQTNQSLRYVACGRNNKGKAIVFGLDSIGTTIWVKKVTNFSYSTYNDIMQLPSSGDFIVTGYQGYKKQETAIVTRINSYGNIQFSQEYIPNGRHLILHAACSDKLGNGNDSTVYLTGNLNFYIDADHIDADVVLMNIDQNTGALLLSNYYDVNQYQLAEKGLDIIKLTNSNEIAITGETKIEEIGLQIYNGYILRLDVQGNFISSTLFGKFSDNRLPQIKRNNANDGYVLGGQFFKTSTTQDNPFIVEAYNSVQQKCRSIDRIIEPQHFDIDTTLVFHQYDSIFAVNYPLLAVNDLVYEQVQCPKEYAPVKRIGLLEEQAQTEEDLLIAPSQTNNYVYISRISSLVKYQVYSVNGQLVKSGQSESKSSLKIDFSSLPKGMYILRVLHNNKYTSKKIIRL